MASTIWKWVGYLFDGVKMLASLPELSRRLVDLKWSAIEKGDSSVSGITWFDVNG